MTDQLCTCGEPLTGKSPLCRACARERRFLARNGSDASYSDGRAPAVRLVVPPRCYLAPINCPACDEGEGLQILSAGRQGVARNYADLRPGEVNWVLR